MNKYIWIFIFFCLSCSFLMAQPGTNTIDYSQPKQYEIGGIEVQGASFSDENAIIAISGLAVGKKVTIPGPDIPNTIKNLWSLKLFTDVQIHYNKKIGDLIFLTITVEERPRLSRHSFKGIRKLHHDDMNATVKRHLQKGSIVTESMKVNAANALKKFWVEKGFLDTDVEVLEVTDTILRNSVRLLFDIDRNKKVKIHDIVFNGNTTVKSKKLIRLMKGTRRQRRIFSLSKFIDGDYKNDKKELIKYYNTIGFRDAKILSDSVYRNEKGKIVLNIDLEEGNRYYFRDIVFNGNSVYTDEQLTRTLNIEKGEVYDSELLETRLRFSPDGRDVSSLYMDNGYLFFNVNPIEKSIDKDSIDLEIRIFEGAQATIDKVTIKGNDRTHEHVIRRELRTRPGEKFSRSDIIRSQREIVSLGYFNPEALGINTPVNPQRGTVDIEYTVEEKPSDQLELSAGWGGTGRGVIGTLGVSFNNFSLRNILDRSTWNPLPQGDGQRLSLRAQTSGNIFQSYNISFTEPWLGGKKPNAFTVAAFHSRYTNGADKESTVFQQLTFTGVSVGLGTRLRWPDDFFVSNTTLSFQNISLNNWSGFSVDDGTLLRFGDYNNISIKQTISRNSVNEPIFPRSGSRVTLSAQFTLPYSLLNGRDYSNETAEEKFKWLEYHKWNFKAEWFTPLFDKMVLKAGMKLGMLGYYNKEVGRSPFERFELGGDGISNQGGLEGKDIISLRGYDVPDIPANYVAGGNTRVGAAVYDKFTLEMRYPFSLNPNATIFGLAFLEGGNAWRNFRDFNPFDIKRSTGLGLRVFLPMFGILGFDYGIGWDKNLPSDSTWTEFGRFSIILGFEPE